MEFTMNKRPNIIIFNPDQFRSEALGHLGNTAAVTPNLDAVCKTDGVSFKNAYCQNPVCTPSRCSFMSGWYPHVRGHRTMFNMMQPDEPVLLKRLKEEGYYVWWGGKNDLVPAQNSFEPYCTKKHKLTDKVRPSNYANQSWRGKMGDDTFYSFFAGKLEKGEEEYYHDSDWDHVLAAVDLIKSPPSDQPLCIYLPIEYPHPPYGVEDPWYSLIDREKISDPISTPENWNEKPSILKGLYENYGMQGWTKERWIELKATYYGMCSRVDYQFGLIVEALKEADMYDNTAIFFFSDHGDFTGDYGLVEKTQNTFEDVLTNVPFIIKPPKSFDVDPRVSDALVELVDFSATVEAMLGIKSEFTSFGKSLLPVIAGEMDTHRDAVFCEGGRLHDELHCMELNSLGAYDKSQMYWPRLSLQVSEGSEHSKAVMLRTQDYKYVYRMYEKHELYDLLRDPKELNNEIDNQEYDEVLATLRSRLLQFFMETGDVVPYKMDKR